MDRLQIPVLKQNDTWYFFLYSFFWPSKQNIMEEKIWGFFAK